MNEIIGSCWPLLVRRAAIWSMPLWGFLIADCVLSRLAVDSISLAQAPGIYLYLILSLGNSLHSFNLAVLCGLSCLFYFFAVLGLLKVWGRAKVRYPKLAKSAIHKSVNSRPDSQPTVCQEAIVEDSGYTVWFRRLYATNLVLMVGLMLLYMGVLLILPGGQPGILPYLKMTAEPFLITVFIALNVWGVVRDRRHRIRRMGIIVFLLAWLIFLVIEPWGRYFILLET